MLDHCGGTDEEKLADIDKDLTMFAHAEMTIGGATSGPEDCGGIEMDVTSVEEADNVPESFSEFRFGDDDAWSSAQ